MMPTHSDSAPLAVPIPHVCPEGHPFDAKRFCYECGTHTACCAAPAVERATAPGERYLPAEVPPLVDDATFASMLAAAERVADEVGCNSAAVYQQASRTITRLVRHLKRHRTEVDTLRATLAAQAERERALIEVVQDHALVERHTETRAHGSQDLYRMPFRGASWFDSREAAVADWLSAHAPTPIEAPRDA